MNADSGLGAWNVAASVPTTWAAGALLDVPEPHRNDLVKSFRMSNHDLSLSLFLHVYIYI